MCLQVAPKDFSNKPSILPSISESIELQELTEKVEKVAKKNPINKQSPAGSKKDKARRKPSFYLSLFNLHGFYGDFCGAQGLYPY